MSPRLLLAIALASLALIAVLYAVASSRISGQLPQPDAAEPLMPAAEDSSTLDTAPDAGEEDTSARQTEQEPEAGTRGSSDSVTAESGERNDASSESTRDPLSATDEQATDEQATESQGASATGTINGTVEDVPTASDIGPADAAVAAPNGAGDAEVSAESQPLAEEAVGDSAPAEEAASNSDSSN